MEYNYGFDYTFPEAMMEGAFAGAAGVVVGIVLIVWFLALAVSVVSYVLSAVGMYRIASRRGIHHAWLAWVPVVSDWLLGSISDHYQYVTNHRVTKRRRIMLLFGLTAAIPSFLITVISLIVRFSTGFAGGEMGPSVFTVAIMVLVYVAIMGMGIALTVFRYIAYFDLFRSCRPEYGVLFLVLGVLFSVALPFFVFACSNSDQGMPARREQRPPVEQPPFEPEDVPPVEADYTSADDVFPTIDDL